METKYHEHTVYLHKNLMNKKTDALFNELSDPLTKRSQNYIEEDMFFLDVKKKINPNKILKKTKRLSKIDFKTMPTIQTEDILIQTEDINCLISNMENLTIVDNTLQNQLIEINQDDILIEQ